jgi:hypothetical protein
VREAGYKVMACVEPYIKQVRVLSRVDMLRRFRAWFEAAQRKQAAPYETIQALAFQVCRESVLRLEGLLRVSKGDLRLAYLEVLLCLNALSYMCAFKDNEASQGAAESLRQSVAELLEIYPRTLALLSEDLGWLKPSETAGAERVASDGSPTAQQIASWREFWCMMLEPFRSLFNSPLGRKLEDEGIFAFLKEDQQVKAEYSFYKDLP